MNENKQQDDYSVFFNGAIFQPLPQFEPQDSPLVVEHVRHFSEFETLSQVGNIDEFVDVFLMFLADDATPVKDFVVQEMKKDQYDALTPVQKACYAFLTDLAEMKKFVKLCNADNMKRFFECVNLEIKNEEEKIKITDKTMVEEFEDLDMHTVIRAAFKLGDGNVPAAFVFNLFCIENMKLEGCFKQYQELKVKVYAFINENGK